MKRRLVAALIALVGLAGAGCAADDPPFTDHRAAVVDVFADGCSLEPAVGAGFAIEHGSGSLVLTSAHTVAGADEITIVHAGTAVPATLVGFDPALDVAVLRGPTSANPVPVARPRIGQPAVAFLTRAGEGDQPVAVGTRVDRLLRVTIDDIYREAEVMRQAFEFQAPIEPGDSGGPIIDASGAAIGLVYARSRARDGTAFAVSGTDLRVMLRTLDPTAPVESGRCL